MKHVFFLLLLSLGVSFVSAQSLRVISKSDTVFFDPSDAGGAIIDGVAILQNASNQNHSYSVVRVTNDLAPGHQTQVCIGTLCLAPNVDSSQVPLNVNAAQNDSTFKVQLLPNGMAGLSRVEMRFQNLSDPSDELTFEIVFNDMPGTALDASALARGFRLEAPVPNPATTSARVAYELPASVRGTLHLTDLMGRTLRSQPLGAQAGYTTVNLEGLAAGSYLLRLEAEGAVVGSVALRVQ